MALLFALSGAIGGFLGGLLGAGGGVVLVFALNFLLPRWQRGGEENQFDRRDVFSSTLMIVLASSLLSAFLYIKNGDFDLSNALPFLIGALGGGVAGGILLDSFSSSVVRWIFAVITAVAGGIMLFR